MISLVYYKLQVVVSYLAVVLDPCILTYTELARTLSISFSSGRLSHRLSD